MLVKKPQMWCDLQRRTGGGAQREDKKRDDHNPLDKWDIIISYATGREYRREESRYLTS